LAIVFSLGAYGWVGHVLTLFNMMALMLVLGIGVNYSIFLVEGGERSVVNFVGVQLSAATTLLSFGLLSFSSMPALSGFGLSLALGIALAVLLAPMTLSLAPTVRTPT
jgi:predicted exporter